MFPLARRRQPRLDVTLRYNHRLRDAHSDKSRTKNVQRFLLARNIGMRSNNPTFPSRARMRIMLSVVPIHNEEPDPFRRPPLLHLSEFQPPTNPAGLIIWSAGARSLRPDSSA